jgi:hydroxylysine kinase
VQGIPGFASRGEVVTWDPARPFERITPSAAIYIARDLFDLDVLTVARMETERDDTFRLRTRSGDLLLKVAPPGDSAPVIDLQTRALQFAQTRDAELPLQHFIQSRDGEIAPALSSHDHRIARVLTWLPGTLLQNSTPNDAQVVALGESLGRLSVALRGFEHPASEYSMAWDLGQAGRLRTVSEIMPDAAVTEALDRYDDVVVPVLEELPRQIIHNDFNPGNVVVDEDDPAYVTGILDFGDTIHSIRVGDLACALSYQLWPIGRSWADCAPFIEGFERRVLLLPAERAVLKTLVLTRFAQRVLINGWLAREGEGRMHDPTSLAATRHKLESLLGEI